MPRLHHVYLVPGFFGFANLGQIAYFGHVRRLLATSLPELGARAEIHVVRTHPTASLPQRAARLAETITETAQGSGPIHVIGHSSGGLDARLLAAPGAVLPAHVDPQRFLSRLRSIVSVAAPHHGTPLASSFATLRGQRLLQVLSLGTIHVLHAGRLPLSVVLRLGGILARTGERGGGDLVDEIFASLLADFSVGRRRAVRALLAEIVRDQSLLLQLTPEAMDVFDATVRDRPGVRYGCVVAEAAPPGLLSVLDAGLDPAAQATHAIYGALYRLAAATPARRAPSLSPAQTRTLRRALGTAPSLAANDGIVPTRSQVHGRILQAVRADHLDVLGHFRNGSADPPHVDWMMTGSRFGRPQFERLWRTVARFLARSAERTDRASRAFGPQPQAGRRR